MTDLNNSKNWYDVDLFNSYPESLISSQVLLQINDKLHIVKDNEIDNIEELNFKKLDLRIPQISKYHDGISIASYKTINWIGIILELNEDSFIAKLYDSNESESETYEIGTFMLDEISESDKDLLGIGSKFYWSVGYSVNLKSGQINKESSIRFQRLTWSTEDYDSVTDSADKIFSENIFE